MNRPHPHRVDAQPGKLSRRRMLQRVGVILGSFAIALLPARAGADSRVPLSLQVLLLSHLGRYDRNFKARAGAVANILVVYRKGNSDSAFEQASLVKALAELRDIGDVPLHVADAEFVDAESLARRCRVERIAVLYLTVGLEEDTPRLATALANGNILTVGTNARHAENGAVVGFALEEARPRIIINLPRAKLQQVDFRAEVLRLARLIASPRVAEPK